MPSTLFSFSEQQAAQFGVIVNVFVCLCACAYAYAVFYVRINGVLFSIHVESLMRA